MFFTTVAELRRWFRTNGKKQTELYVGFYRKDADVKAVTYPEALDEALCWGWIDGVRKKVDSIRYTNRFTPRKPNSIWSHVNIKNVERLLAEARMMPAGLAAFENRNAERSGVYSFEQTSIEFDGTLLAMFQENKAAWAFWEKQPPGYRRVATHWVTSAKRQETRQRRLQTLIVDSENGRRLAEATGKTRKKS